MDVVELDVAGYDDVGGELEFYGYLGLGWVEFECCYAQFRAQLLCLLTVFYDDILVFE